MANRKGLIISLILLNAVIANFAFADTMLFKLKDVENSRPLSVFEGNKIAGHEEVIRNLRDRSIVAQSDFIAVLISDFQKGNISSYRAFWIANIIAVTAEREILISLATHRSVENAYDDLPINLIEPVEIEQENLIMSGAESGLRIIKAVEAWEIGLDGSGSLVCNFDTGVNGNHEALINKYRGNNGGEAAACWFDPYTNTQYPVDSHGHGTHTMGIMTGSEGADTIGVAPNAQWIAAAVVDRGGGVQRTISDLLAAFQWAADPDGNPATIDDVPDVVNNSWGIPLGYYAACSETFWEAIDNLEAAGVVCIFAAGNEGPHAISLRTPADRIMSDFNAFAVGAIDGTNSNLSIASFSSRGPSGCDSITIKPEVAAPGIRIRSAARMGGYVNMSGTSMAAPHVAGAAALLRQFNPQATTDEIKMALMYSAEDRGEPGQDNSYGWGIINIRRALYYMPPPNGIFPVMISKEIDGDGIVLPGEQATMGMLIENLGEPCNGLTARLICNDERIEICSPDMPLGQFERFDTLYAGPWNINFGADLITGENVTFVLSLISGVEQRSIQINITIGGDGERGIASHDNGQLATSFSNFGQFGLGVNSVNPQNGLGFKYPSDSQDYLRLGSILLATDSLHVSDACQTFDPYMTDDDFAPAVGGYPFINSPGAISDQDGFASYNDSQAENPLGVIINQKSYCWTEPDRASFIIYEFIVKNSGNQNVDMLKFGLQCDWSISSGGAEDLVGFAPENSTGYMTDQQSGLAIGLRVLSHDILSYAAIDNNQILWDGFSDSEKYNELCSGLQHMETIIPGEYSHLIAAGPFNIGVDDSIIIAIAMIAGNNLDELMISSNNAYATYHELTKIEGGELALPREEKLLQNYPNPFNGRTIIKFSGSVDQHRTIFVYDISGRMIKEIMPDANGMAVWDGTDANGSYVCTGIYFAKLNNGDGPSRKMILLK